MTILQVAIVDDEPIARSRLARLLKKIGGPRLNLAVECVDADELVSQAARIPLDLLFLDVEMPGGGGFSALARWPGPRPMVVFVSAYPAYALKAFDFRAVDYLMKPISAERLRESLVRVHDAMGFRHASGDAEATPAANRVPLQLGKRTHLVSPNAIEAVVARGNYLEVHTSDSTYVIRRTLSAFEAELDQGTFIRLHRSVLVRRDAVLAIKSGGSGRYLLELQGGRSYYSGRNYRAAVQALLNR